MNKELRIKELVSSIRYQVSRRRLIHYHFILYTLYFILFITTSVALFTPLPKALAQSDIVPSISISPAVFEFDVVGGEEINRVIKITNASAAALPIKVRAVNFEAADETGGIRFVTDPAMEEELSAYSWLTINPLDFIVGPGESREISLQINVPSAAVPGGHYATVLFEPQLPSFYFEAEATRLVPVVGALVMFNVQKLNLSALDNANPLSLVGFDLTDQGKIRTEALVKGLNSMLTWFRVNKALAASDWSIYETVPQEVDLRLKNNGIFHIRPSGSLSVFNVFGNQVASASLEQTTILPQRIRRIPLTLSWSSDDGFFPQAYGRYTMVFSAQTEQGDITARINFWVIPWVFILSTMLVFGMFIYFVLKYRRRLLISFQVLIGRN